jgi:hypothetical protein
MVQGACRCQTRIRTGSGEVGLTRKTRIARAVCALAANLGLSRAPPSSGQASPGFVTPRRALSSGCDGVRLEYTMRDDAGMVLDASRASLACSRMAGTRSSPGWSARFSGVGVGEEKRVGVGGGRLRRGRSGCAGRGAARDDPGRRPEGRVGARGTRPRRCDPRGSSRGAQETTVVRDLNHPFAGTVLHFAVRGPRHRRIVAPMGMGGAVTERSATAPQSRRRSAAARGNTDARAAA